MEKQPAAAPASEALEVFILSVLAARFFSQFSFIIKTPFQINVMIETGVVLFLCGANLQRFIGHAAGSMPGYAAKKGALLP